MNPTRATYLLIIAVVALALASPVVPGFAPQTAQAAGPWYVAPGGSDGDDCLSPATPCATINGALGRASAGDTINVAAGTYTGSGSQVVLIDKDITLSGGWDDTFTSQSGMSATDGGSIRRGITVGSGVTATVERFDVHNGQADHSYGGGVINQGSLTLNSVVVRNNGASFGYGGGIAIPPGAGPYALALNNSIVSGNTSTFDGGGMALWSGQVSINNSTITGNLATNAFPNSIYGGATLRNSILWGNGSDDCPGFTSGGYNLVGTFIFPCPYVPPPAAGDLVNVNPLLVNLGGYFALAPGSPAIDAGDPGGCSDNLGSPLAADLRGTSRPLDGNNDTLARCDIGAYEFDPGNPVRQVFLPLALTPCPTLYSDNFSNDASGWPVDEDADVRYQYLNGEYRILVKTADYVAGAAPGFAAPNFIASVSLRNASGVNGSYGLLFGLDDDWTQFYTFEITRTGDYALWRYNANTWTLLDSGSSAGILTGAATNRLKVEREGAAIRAFVNDQLLANINDASLTGFRRAGLVASSFAQGNVDVRFDDFAAYPAACDAAGVLAANQGNGKPEVGKLPGR